MKNAIIIDQNNCVHFKDIEKNLFRTKIKDVEICGGRYTIESKWKR